MKLEDLRRMPSVNSAVLFVLAAFTGWSVFNLQLVSLVRLLEGSGIDWLPALMLLQAGCSWLLLRGWGHQARGSDRNFFASALIAGALISIFAHHPAVAEYSHRAQWGWWIYGALFILSQVLIGALRLGVHVMFSQRVSVLSNPQISTQLSISEEAGFMVGVLSVMGTRSFAGMSTLIGSLAPFAGGLIVLAFLGNGRRNVRAELARGLAQREPAPVATDAQPKAVAPAPVPAKRMPPFFPWIIALFSAVASLKSIQWFGMAYGLSEASRQGFEVLSLFSRLTLIQSALTLGILVASLGFSSRIPTWGVGFKVLLFAQAVGCAILSLFPSPYFLMGTEIMRKVLERGFLGRSLQLLTSTLPEENRFESRHFMERWSTTLGTAAAGALALLSVQGYLPFGLLWALMTGVAMTGFLLRRRLFDTLCDFHVSRLRQSNLGGILQACHALGNPDCARHHAALTSLLERNPRPVLRKSLLYALGRLRHPSAVPAILHQIPADREDIQLAAVRAVERYPGHEINLILLKTLRDMVRSNVPMRMSVIRCITQRLGRLVVPYLLEVLESGPDSRVSANAIEILGEIAVLEKDEDLKGYVAKFLQASQPRRVRANAVVILYRDRTHGEAALEAFDRLLTSDDRLELDAAAYVAGVLNLRGHESYIWERSESLRHSNSTLLVALLRLGNPKAPALLARWIVEADEARAREALTRMSTLSPAIRAKVFLEVIEASPDSLSFVFERIRKSQRDFETDRELIRQEAQRLGLKLVEEDPPVSLQEAA